MHNPSDEELDQIIRQSFEKIREEILTIHKAYLRAGNYAAAREVLRELSRFKAGPELPDAPIWPLLTKLPGSSSKN